MMDQVKTGRRFPKWEASHFIRFHKSIRNYIVSGIEGGTIGTGNDNGYNGEYPGWTFLAAANAGAAVVQGWEFSYQQQFTFLPGVLKGLSATINYTVLDTHGNFPVAGSLPTTAARANGQIAGFVPRTANASLSWRYRRFSTRVRSNYATTFLTSYSAATPYRNLYRVKRNLVNVGFAYQVRPSVNLTLDSEKNIAPRHGREGSRRTKLNSEARKPEYSVSWFPRGFIPSGTGRER